MAEFRIGVDLGTTNCALAWIRCDDREGRPQIFPLAQRTGARAIARLHLLPSFLALPPGESSWVVGSYSRSLATDLSGRVIYSAKSWLGHHAVDRHARFLPLGRGEITEEQKLSPLQASQALLQHMRSCWDDAHPGAPLDRQEVALTVPASFDPVAQQLTLEAALAAGFPSQTVLLEEPQAAFSARLGDGDAMQKSEAASRHILVVDIGGGTTDFSLFQLHSSGQLERTAVGDHILLGGDNLDLALAHRLEAGLEARPGDGDTLPASVFANLIVRAREIKEEFFTAEGKHPTGDSWQVAVALPGASLLRGTLRTQISDTEIFPILVDGFFPLVGKREKPLSAPGGLREMGLPYASDPAITRHLAAFLNQRPPVEAVFFNGGMTKSAFLRSRLIDLIATWQDGLRPVEWSNPEPDCAVALGAARFLHEKAAGTAIEARSARSYYLGVGNGMAVCVLPQGQETGVVSEASPAGLVATVGQPVSFPLYQHSRRMADRAGDSIALEDDFQQLPGLETILTPPKNGRKARQTRVKVGLRSRLRATGILEIEVVCREFSLKWSDPWSLHFSLRSEDKSHAAALRALDSSLIARAADAMIARLHRGTGSRLTGNSVLVLAEEILSQERNSWGAGTVRLLFDLLAEAPGIFPLNSGNSEVMSQVLSFLLRPGRGVPGDDGRVALLLPELLIRGGSVSKAQRLQQWVAVRRISAGLTAEDAGRVWSAVEDVWRNDKAPPTELVLLAGSLDSLPGAIRIEIGRRFRFLIRQFPGDQMLWRSLGRVLSRYLFHTGADQVLPATEVVAAWEDLSGVAVPLSARREAAACWLRAGRRTGLREIDLPGEIRKAMDRQLRAWEIDEVRRRVLHETVPLVELDQSRLLGEAPPPGLAFD